MTHSHPPVPPLPVRVRPLTFETSQSYAGRLLSANAVTESVWPIFVHSLAQGTRPSRRAGAEALLEALGDLRPGHFAHQKSLRPSHEDGTRCRKCTTGLSERYVCTLCSAGAVVAQYEHDGPRICRRHLRWIGPGTAHDEQFAVDIKQ